MYIVIYTRSAKKLKRWALPCHNIVDVHSESFYLFTYFSRHLVILLHIFNDWNSAPAEVRLKLSSPSDESLELFD